MAGIHDAIGRDSAPVGGEKDVKDTSARESRVVESDADSTDSRAGSIWTIVGSVSFASRWPGPGMGY